MTGTPTDLVSMRSGYDTVQLSWTAPASNTPPVAGYEVFYAVSGSDIAQSGGTTNETTITVTLPTLGVMYDFFVVAFSDAPNSLPSARSDVATIELIELNMPTEGTAMQEETDPPAGSSNTPAIVGNVIVVLVIVTIVLVVIVL